MYDKRMHSLKSRKKSPKPVFRISKSFEVRGLSLWLGVVVGLTRFV